MNTIYFFFDGDKVRIPFTDFDKGLFNWLYNTRMGQWDNNKQQYSILRTKYNPEIIKTVLEGITYIEVGKEANAPVLINGFLGEWEDEPEELAPETETITNITVQEDELPEQFTEHWRGKLEDEMRALKLSKHTIDAYINNNKALCKWLQKKPEEVTTDDIKRYLAHHEKYKQYAAATLNSILSAFKFFYINVMKRDVAKDQRRPHQDKRLPVVLAKSEVKMILDSGTDSEPNLKHRLLLMMIYASGLRVSEAVNLRKQDIDTARKTIMITGGKGRKDRRTLLSDMVLGTLKLYYQQYKITDWLFGGADPSHHLAIRSAQHICKHAIKKANLEKKASIHSLRHSFATHLLEAGTGITHIRDLLGHSSVQTTERYLRVAKLRTLKITSPLDTIDQEDSYEGEDDYSPENRQCIPPK